MEHAEVELFLGGEMGHAGNECLAEGPGMGPCGTGSVDGGAGLPCCSEV